MFKKRKSHLFILLLLLCLSAQLAWSGTTGKISGVVTDQESGEPLMGANIKIDGTLLGAATDEHGQYTIINVPPGMYTVSASYMGYTPVNTEDVRVQLNETSPVDFNMNMETVQGEVVTVSAEKHIIKRDVAASTANMSSEQIDKLPVVNIRDVVGLQAGVHANIQDGIQIRGGAGSTLFLVDGVTYRDPRDNAALTGVSLAAISEISVERGGFNAEYGQVRSGIINVVTKEGSRKNYFGSFSLKGAPPTRKYDGISPFDPNSMWLRPYFDDAVCWTGTDNGNWSEAMQEQYPQFQGGWNAVSRESLEDDDPTNDLTPIGAQREYMWEHRKADKNKSWDYNVDAGLGGPVPFISEKLGGLRFFASYRRDREMYVVPTSRDDYVDYDYSLKLTSDISNAMKLTASYAGGKQLTIANNWAANDFQGLYYLREPIDVVAAFGGEDFQLFSTGYFSIGDINHDIFSVKLTHTLNQKTFYETSLEHVARKYYTRPPAARDTSKIYEIVPGYYADEGLFGYAKQTHYSRARDNSKTSSTTFKFNLTSQVTFNHLIKTGLEFMYSDLDIYYGYVSSFTGNDDPVNVQNTHTFPYRGSFYLQDKMEFKELIVNLGLRLDYSNSNTEWVNVDQWNETFYSSNYDPNIDYPKEKAKAEWSLSPRLSISHPVTENSKLYFNYGHFMELPNYQELFRIARDVNNAVKHYGNPNLTLSKTIAYELGYEHSLFDQYLLQLSGFYRDVTDQRSAVLYQGRSSVNYTQVETDNYGDYRGFELTLRKNTGDWMTGLLAYTYQVNKAGNFGYAQVYQNPFDNRQYQERSTDVYLQRPVAQPYATANVNFSFPSSFKKATVMGFNPLENLNISFVGNWQAGPKMTYNPRTITGLVNNVKAVDRYDITLRVNKIFTVHRFNFDFSVEVQNLLNTKFLAIGRTYTTSSTPQYGCFWDYNDYLAYMASLHLPQSDAYDNLVGDDKIGDYRKPGVAYQPIEYYNVQLATGTPGVIYYDRNTSQYLEYVSADGSTGDWQQVSQSKMDKILDDKAYIDMPNLSSFWFLRPRVVFLGLKVSFDLN